MILLRYFDWRSTMVRPLSAWMLAMAAVLEPLLSTANSGERRQHLGGPPVNGRVIDRHATFGHHLLQMPQAQRVGYVPAHANQDHFNWIMQPLKNAAQRFVHRFLFRAHQTS